MFGKILKSKHTVMFIFTGAMSYIIWIGLTGGDCLIELAYVFIWVTLFSYFMWFVKIMFVEG